MQFLRTNRILVGLVVAAAAAPVAGLLVGHLWAGLAAGVVALGPVGAWWWWSRRPARAPFHSYSAPSSPGISSVSSRPVPPVALDLDALADGSETGQLVVSMLRLGRYALVLRPQIVKNLSATQLKTAARALDEGMALVPEGDVLMQATRLDEADEGEQLEKLVRVEAYYLDRYPVTNGDYKQFVDAGGYEQMGLWDPAVWAGVLDFVDKTGHPGPAFWEHGTYPEDRADHPVVGVSWYEASAFARWVGKRLPTDPEWVKAGCWPVLASGRRPVQRKFPWGDTLDAKRANIWPTGPKTTTSVYQNPDGVSVGGVYQLIGNAWEWTSTNFGAWDPAARKLESELPMKSLRGGAFDTYFETHATCQFQSGDTPLARKHNIGFRCAVGLCDVVSTIVDLEQTRNFPTDDPSGGELCPAGTQEASV